MSIALLLGDRGPLPEVISESDSDAMWKLWLDAEESVKLLLAAVETQRRSEPGTDARA